MPSPFTFTDEGTECQPVRAVLGLQSGPSACGSGEGVASSQRAGKCGLKTLSLRLYHLGPRLKLSLAQDQHCNTLKNVVHSPRETVQSGSLPPSLSVCLKSGKGVRGPRLPQVGHSRRLALCWTWVWVFRHLTASHLRRG